ncbi:uncharacterized protein LOC129586873 [Paramacrobiotus metropolitanus]|uniref:uncharacterized protein LOC129586873 n=1 Tax=Paramacrobiotus metropolitanus TaxID=2943436 RepID=UPI00244569B4|nr:uncharacterized protein LOC129586873 [Paramacrobiotus metropolitanus]XP_055336321.1 uncharacterized protein LOC129586873 [Paramacrobiotus metropolitanus]XP_055336322.1 uncharacterized protein LOC129586873 [Paramacrobiotus metropolitanus]
MVTTTTKVLNYTIERGPSKNIVSATITSTPGVNVGYFTKPPGILRILQLILTAVALGLIIFQISIHRAFKKDVYGFDLPIKDYERETVLAGELFFLCVHYAVLILLLIFIITYFISLVSEIVIIKTSTLDAVLNLVVAVLLLIAAIVELTMTVQWTYDREATLMMPRGRIEGTHRVVQELVVISTPRPYTPIMYTRDWGIRIAAGVIALVNALLFIVSFVFSRKEYYAEQHVVPPGYVPPAAQPVGMTAPVRSSQSAALATTTVTRHSPDEF